MEAVVSIKIGNGFAVGNDGKVKSIARKIGSVSDRIRKRKSKRVYVVSRAQAMAKANRP